MSVITIECTWEDSLLVQVLIGHRQDEMTARPYDAHPIPQSFARVAQVLQAVAAVQKVVGLVGHASKILRVAILQVPCADRGDARKQLRIERQRVGLSSNVDP